MTAITKLKLAIEAAERDPHGGKVILDLDTARVLRDEFAHRGKGPRDDIQTK